jgi:signal transduction histidine kinase
VRSFLRWCEEHIPAAVLLALPGLTIAAVSPLVTHSLIWRVLAGPLAGFLTAFAGVLLMVRSGWVSDWRELRTFSIAGARRARSALVQRTAVLQRVVEELRDSSDRASGVTSRLLNELVRAEESTRANLAAELHDTVAQCLSIALMGLGDVTESRHVQARESVRDAESQLRTVLARIRPPELAEGDLAQAVADLCEDLDRRYGVQVDVNWTADGVLLSVSVATLVYRFLQETLLNAVEHADGIGVGLSLEVIPDEDGPLFTATVTDRGPGFVPSAIDSSGGRHVGLKLARERARLAGGDLTITSTLGVGTKVQLRLPLYADGGVRPRRSAGQGGRRPEEAAG